MNGRRPRALLPRIVAWVSSMETFALKACTGFNNGVNASSFLCALVFYVALIRSRASKSKTLCKRQASDSFKSIFEVINACLSFIEYLFLLPQFSNVLIDTIMKALTTPESRRPSTTKDADCKPPDSPPPTEAQISYFYSLLHDFSETSSVRGLLNILSNCVTRHCPICTEPGTCGQSCPLLCPPGVDRVLLYGDIEWCKKLSRYAGLWEILHTEMRLHMATASARQIRVWERTAR